MVLRDVSKLIPSQLHIELQRHVMEVNYVIHNWKLESRNACNYRATVHQIFNGKVFIIKRRKIYINDAGKNLASRPRRARKSPSMAMAFHNVACSSWSTQINNITQVPSHPPPQTEMRTGRWTHNISFLSLSVGGALENMFTHNPLSSLTMFIC